MNLGVCDSSRYSTCGEQASNIVLPIQYSSFAYILVYYISLIDPPRSHTYLGPLSEKEHDDLGGMGRFGTTYMDNQGHGAGRGSADCFGVAPLL